MIFKNIRHTEKLSIVRMLVIALLFTVFSACSPPFDKQETLVRDFLAAVQQQDDNKLMMLMPDLALRSSEERAKFRSELAAFGQYRLQGTRTFGATDIVSVEFKNSSGTHTVGIPVVQKNGTYFIGDSFRLKTTIDFFPLQETPHKKE
jgi:hypothetical protein